MGWFLLRGGFDKHDEVGGMAGCAEHSMSCLCFVEWGFIDYLFLHVCQFLWLEVDVGTFGEQFTIFSLFQTLVFVVPTCSLDEQSVDVGT